MTERDQIDHQRGQGVDLSLKGLDVAREIGHSASPVVVVIAGDGESAVRETAPSTDRSADRTETSGWAVFGAPVSDEAPADRFEMWMFKQGAWAACPDCGAPLAPGDVHRCDR